MKLRRLHEITAFVLLAAGMQTISPVMAEVENMSKTQTQPVVQEKPQVSKELLNALAHEFHQVHVSAHRLRRTCQSLTDEFNRTSLKILTYDDYINQYIDGKPVAYNEQLYPYGFQNIGNTSTTAGDPLPARKEYVSHFVKEAASLSSLIGQELDSAASSLPDTVSGAPLASMKRSLLDAKEAIDLCIKSISDLCGSEPYDKAAIVKFCNDLSAKLTELDSTCKLTMKMIATKRN